MLGQLGAVVEGDGREEVVRNVIVRDLSFVVKREIIKKEVSN